MITVILWIWMVFVHGVICSNLFTGTDGMKKLSRGEHLVLKDIEEAADKIQSKLNLLKR